MIGPLLVTAPRSEQCRGIHQPGNSNGFVFHSTSLTGVRRLFLVLPHKHHINAHVYRLDALESRLPGGGLWYRTDRTRSHDATARRSCRRGRVGTRRRRPSFAWRSWLLQTAGIISGVISVAEKDGSGVAVREPNVYRTTSSCRWGFSCY